MENRFYTFCTLFCPTIDCLTLCVRKLFSLEHKPIYCHVYHSGKEGHQTQIWFSVNFFP